MADDKGGGGKSWEPFEVVIVILLAIGLLTKLQGTPKAAAPQTGTKSEITAQQSASSCGLVIARPHSLEKVTTSVTLVGTTNGCNWPSTPTVALYAQVIDASGKPVSDYTSVPPGAVDGISTAFDISIPLTGAPASGKGTLILLPAQSSGNQATSVRIPIVFSSQ